MERVVILIVCCGLSGILFGAPAISSQKVTPIPPWGLAIDFVVEGAEESDRGSGLVVEASDGVTTYVASELKGDLDCENGSHRIYWNAAADGVSAEAVSGRVKVGFLSKYCVVDLSGGPEASTYPVSYMGNLPDGDQADVYKTTKLVLRRLDAGNFNMQGTTPVTLTKPFYIGVYEVTQKQWALVMGSSPSYFKGDKFPVECVSYDMIRGSSSGANWPSSSAVDAGSFLGRLRARSKLAFDLPTEAEWEYACRAGTSTTYSYGSSANGNYMWYSTNSGSTTHEVGAKFPNPWGLYDMHGNVDEWCRDGYSSSIGTSPLIDPVGPKYGASSHGSYDRVLRGGNYKKSAEECTSNYRYGYAHERVAHFNADWGCRVMVPIQN